MRDLLRVTKKLRYANEVILLSMKITVDTVVLAVIFEDKAIILS